MSPPISFHLTCVLIPFLLVVHFPLTSPQLLKGCGFSAIYNLGDSVSDTGNNLVQFDFGGSGQYPYGMTVGKPTGRFSDGLLLIDRIAESAGLPHCNPYLRKDMDHSKGANFAVAGVGLLSKAQRDKFGIHFNYSQSGLDEQLKWFVNYSKEAFPNESARKANFESALFVLGGGGNDYGGFKVGVEEKKKIMPYVIGVLEEGLKTVIHHGARRIVAMGVYQAGCLPGFNKTILEHDQGPIVCDKQWNSYHDLHNKQVQKLVLELGKEFPHVHLAYGDIWDGVQWMFDNYRSLGLKHTSYARCCGTEEHKTCGEPGTPFCKDPYHYIWWDNFHFTDHAYQLIARKVIPWIYSVPTITLQASNRVEFVLLEASISSTSCSRLL
ncbi:unnamed protein product [Linum trigynum]|uniref:GDSL esterase/lipase n=1 Tax=Linum trigynum TaxID=586398 RepID=A0AAV2EIA4_9ROSI